MKVLVAVDSVRFLDEVERFFGLFPVELGCDVRVVTVVEDVSRLVQDLGGQTFGASPLYERLQFQARAEATKLLGSVAGRFTDQGFVITTTLLEGNPADEITRYASDHEIDLVVVGSHDLDRLERILIGSVSFQVLTRTHQEVLIVRPSETLRDGNEMTEPRTASILYADDGSRFADEGMNFLRRLAARGSREFRLTVSAVLPLIKLFRMDLRSRLSPSWALQHEARKKSLDDRCVELRGLGFICESLLSEEHDVGAALVTQAEQLSADLVLVGRCGKRSLQRLFPGSTAYHVATQAKCSVWIGAGVDPERG